MSPVAPGREPDAFPGGSIVGPILAFDTATTVAVIALGDAAGSVRAETAWTAGYRHGEELLSRIDQLLTGAAASLDSLGGIVVGTGPGAFTGLRVGIATAKGLASGLDIPIVGVPTRRALQLAAGRALAGAAVGAKASGPVGEPGPIALLLPAGPSDRLLVEPADGPTILVPGGTEAPLDPGWTVAALDLVDRAPAEALALGTRARQGLAAALLAIGAAELAAGRASDLATLVPEYVTLPRGVRVEVGGVAWLRDPR
jgi:tRNA threonylcarbamoyladenosine biosynthesis protein TsaB